MTELSEEDSDSEGDVTALKESVRGFLLGFCQVFSLAGEADEFSW